MLTMHDNVYAMKIRHYQLIIDNMMTFWVENFLAYRHKDLTINFLNVNIPEFVPVSERKETDLDKATKFVSTFTQLEQMLNIKVKTDFILNKLFPNDLISDIIDVDETTKIEEDIQAGGEEETEEDILSLFESGVGIFNDDIDNIKRISHFVNHIDLKDKYKIFKCKFSMAIDW